MVKKKQYKIGQVVMLVPPDEYAVPQPGQFRSYDGEKAIVDFAGKGFSMSLDYIRPLNKEERGN